MIRGSVAVILDNDRKVILQRRDRNAPRNANLLTLFGGHREAVESSRNCLIRELKEETSLDMSTLK
jgi:8-oxo-dGTP pyrophosphatase MutT (NUDIX family)